MFDGEEKEEGGLGGGTRSKRTMISGSEAGSVRSFVEHFDVDF